MVLISGMLVPVSGRPICQRVECSAADSTTRNVAVHSLVRHGKGPGSTSKYMSDGQGVRARSSQCCPSCVGTQGCLLLLGNGVTQ
jgi:hypothetical protein